MGALAVEEVAPVVVAALTVAAQAAAPVVVAALTVAEPVGLARALEPAVLAQALEPAGLAQALEPAGLAQLLEPQGLAQLPAQSLLKPQGLALGQLAERHKATLPGIANIDTIPASCSLGSRGFSLSEATTVRGHRGTMV